eukprot:2699629-Pyramimonas_sp.AAC.1
MADFAVLILSAPVAPLGSRCARSIALSCAGRAAHLPCMSLRNLFMCLFARRAAALSFVCPARARRPFCISLTSLNDRARRLHW